MQGWSASGQTFWWQGLQGTRWRRTSERRDQGRHWPGWLVPLKRTTESDARAGRQVRRAGIGADEQVGPLEQGGRLGDGHPPGPVAEVGRAAASTAAAGGVLGPADHDHPPAVVEEPRDQGLPVAGGPALGRGPRAEVDGQQRRRRSRTGRRAASRRRPRGPAARTATRSSSARPPRGRGAAVARTAAAAGRGAASLVGPGLAEPVGRRRPVAVRRRARPPGRARRPAMPSRSSRASREPTSCRPGTQSATSVSRNPPPPIAQPTRRGMPARASTSTVRMSPADVDAQVVTPRRGAIGPAPRPPSPAPSGPGRRSNQVRVGQADAVDVRVGLEDLAVARRGQHVDRAPRGRPCGAGRAAGWSAPRRPGGRAGRPGSAAGASTGAGAGTAARGASQRSRRRRARGPRTRHRNLL